jgi:hypothetical protein
LKTKQAIKIFTLIVVILNIASIVFLDFFNSQIVRLVSSCLFLLLFIFYKIKDKNLIGFICLLIIADAFDLYYLQPFIIETYSVIKMLAFSLLCVNLYKKFKHQKLGKTITGLFVVVIIINLLIGYKAVSETSTLLDYSQLLSIQLYWIVCVISGALAAKYYFCDDSNKAVYFVGFTFLFIFTDLSGFIANFFEAYAFFFIERLLYYLAFMCLGYYLFFASDLNIEKP